MLAGLGLAIPGLAQAATFTVQSTSDVGDLSPGDGSCLAFISLSNFRCTFRAALEEANALPGTDTIRFNSIPTILSVARLLPASPYPFITDAVIIDGYTAPGYVTSDPWAFPIVHLDGSNIGVTAYGLVFANPGGSGSTLRGLTISGFSGVGVMLRSQGVKVQGCHIGPGFFSNGNGTDGVLATATSSASIIGQDCSGTTCTGKGNWISANGLHGVELQGSTATVAGNRIGTTLDGQGVLGNGGFGVRSTGVSSEIGWVAVDSVLAVATDLSGNLVSGNGTGGIQIVGSGTVMGNLVGTDIDGDTDLGNQGPGIEVLGPSVVIGDGVASSIDVPFWIGNLVSGNQGPGITLGWAGLHSADQAVVRDNRVGIDLGETTSLGNGGEGIVLYEGMGVTIDANVVGGNTVGIELGGPEGATVTSNWVGVTPGGIQVGNFSGIQVVSENHVVGRAGEGNVMAGNAAFGLDLALNSRFNDVWGNWVGVLPDGTAFGNGGTGIYVSGDDNRVGGPAAGDANVIGNNYVGIRQTDTATGTIVTNNYIGTTPGGDPRGNSEAGIRIEGGAQRVGSAGTPSTPDLAEGNEIAFNGGPGVEIMGGVGSPVRGNRIHDNGGLGVDLDGDGVTPNDPLDLDAGPNGRLNYPILRSFVYDELANEVTADYELDVFLGVSFPVRVDLYQADASGEGALWVGGDSFYFLDVGLPKSFVFTPPVGVDLTGASLVAQSTEALDFGSSSEFGPAIPLPEPGGAALLGAGVTLLVGLSRRRVGRSRD
jgi:hypothetical protein